MDSDQTNLYAFLGVIALFLIGWGIINAVFDWWNSHKK
jgi:hypothetical protein